MAGDRSHSQDANNDLIRRRSTTPTAESATSSETPAHPLLRLQRQVGNRGVARMLAQRQAANIQRTEEEEELQTRRDPGIQRAAEEEIQAKRDLSIQRKPAEDLMKAGSQLLNAGTVLSGGLTQPAGPLVSDAGAKVMNAGLVMNIDEAQKQAMAGVQRSVADLQRQSEEEDALQAKRDAPEVGLEGGPISDGLASRIRSKSGGGSPLAEGMRTKMESSFGASFENVRLHTDSESASLSRSVGAKAFTTGNNIFFGPGASPSDEGLVAHELTHTIQQKGMSGSGGPMTVNREGDSHEQEANAMSAAVTSGAAAMRQREVEE